MDFDQLKKIVSSINVISFDSSREEVHYFDLKNDKNYVMSRGNEDWYMIYIKTYTLPSDNSSTSNDVIDEISFEKDSLMLYGCGIFSFAVVDETLPLYFCVFNDSEKVYCDVYGKRGDYIEGQVECLEAKLIRLDNQYYFINWIGKLNNLEVVKLDKSPIFENSLIDGATTYLIWHPEVGYIQSKRNGVFQIEKSLMNLAFGDKYTAKWIHYYNGKLFFMTADDNLCCVNLDEPNSPLNMFSIKDSEIGSSDRDSLMVQAVERIVVFGYEFSEKILFYDSDTCSIIRIMTIDHDLQQFKLSLDLNRLYIHYH